MTRQDYLYIWSCIHMHKKRTTAGRQFYSNKQKVILRILGFLEKNLDILFVNNKIMLYMTIYKIQMRYGKNQNHQSKW